ncbi:MAG: putative hydrolase of alkaline phosphatase superfamily protein, partial [uncultured bacterium]
MKKSPFLLFVQLCLFSIILLYFCRAVFPIDFAALDVLSGGFDIGILWIAGVVFFLALLLKHESKAGLHVYIYLPATLFALFSLAIHGFASMGVWFFAVLCLFAYFVWFIQANIARHKPLFMLLFVPVNFLATILLYIDYVHYSLTREHFNFIYLRIISADGGSFLQAVMSAGLTPFMALLPVAVAFIFVLLIYPVLRFGSAIELPGRRLPAFALSLLFLPVHLQFVILLPEIPLSEYLNFKVRNFWFPLPAAAEFESIAATKLSGTLKNVKIPAETFSRQASYSWLPERKDRNIVFLILESMRQDFLQNAMPETLRLAQDGILCLNHLASSNDTEGSMIALYYGTLPLVSDRSHYDDISSSWLDFMKASNYDFIRLHCSHGNLFFPEYRYVHFRDYYRANGLPIPAETTVYENSRLICDAVIHKLKNTDKKCIIEASLFHTHYKYWYPKQFEKFTPVLDDNSEILSLAFNEAAERLANRYRNSILFTDQLIREFVEKLKSEGLFDDTLLVIIGDHGEMLGEDGKLFHANGGEILQYHTPFILLGKDVPNNVVRKITSHIDIVPTLGGQLGFSVAGSYGSDVLGAVDKGAVTFDIAGQDRMTYRDLKLSSLFY